MNRRGEGVSKDFVAFCRVVSFDGMRPMNAGQGAEIVRRFNLEP